MVKKIPVLNLEGYAINGFVKDYRLVDCEKKGKLRLTKVVATLKDGDTVETDCMEYPRAARIYILLEKYKYLSGPIVKEEITEEMMKGITYDLDHVTSRKG